jgi:hypothetical protein
LKHGSRFGSRRGPAAVIAVFICALAISGAGNPGLSPSGSAQTSSSADGTLEISVDTIIGARFGPKAAKVSLRSRRPVRGTLRFGADQGDSFEVQVELPTSGTRTLWAQTGSDPFSSNATFEEQGGGDLLIYASSKIGSQDTYVGVLPSLHEALPPSRETDTALGPFRASLIELSLDDLESFPWLFDSFDVIAATGADLSQLSEETVGLLVTWIRSGGELVLDDDAKVPVAVQPSGSLGVALERGTVRRTAGKLKGKAWNEVILPTTRWPSPVMEISALASSFQTQREFPRQLLTEQTITLPPTRPLIWGLGAYGVVIGPLVFWSLRKRRPMLSWALGPLIAVAAAGVVFAVGGANRDNSEGQQVVVVELGEGTSTALIQQTFTKRSEISLPSSAWTLSSSSFGYNPFGSASTRKFQGGPEPTVDVNMLSGGFATALVRGPVPDRDLKGGVSINAKWNGTEIEGLATNTGGATLTDVVVMATNSFVRIGKLGAGESAPFVLPALGTEPIPAISFPPVPMDYALETYFAHRDQILLGTVTAIATTGSSSRPIGGPEPKVSALATTSVVQGLSRLTPLPDPSDSRVTHRVTTNGGPMVVPFEWTGGTWRDFAFVSSSGTDPSGKSVGGSTLVQFDNLVQEGP